MRRNFWILAAVFILAALVGMIWFKSANLNKKISAGEKKLNALQEKTRDEKERSKEISELKERMKSDDYKEQIAKDQLGLIRDGEIIFKKSDKKDKTGNDAENAIVPEEVEPEDSDSDLQGGDEMTDTGEADTDTETDNN
jgi:cell division protein DivIC